MGGAVQAKTVRDRGGVLYRDRRGLMNAPKLALWIAWLNVAVVVGFMAYALSGADLCLWCAAVAR